MFKNLNLNLTVLIALIIGLCTPIFITTIFLQKKYEHHLISNLIETNEELLKTISSTLSVHMWNYMPHDAKKTLGHVFKKNDLVKIKVLDLKYNTSTFLQLEKTDYSLENNCADGKFITLNEKIFYSTVELGSVYLTFSTCGILESIHFQKQSLWVSMTILFAFSFLVLFLIIRLKVISPIKQLIHQSNQLSHKKLETPFIWNRNDEVGKLGTTLEKTRLSLLELFHKEQQSKNEVRVLNNNLELRIKEEVEKNHINTQQLMQKSKLEQTGELLSMIAHQWRQPLNTISVIANNLLIQILLGKKTTVQELEEDIKLIIEHTQHLSSTITDFRNFHNSNKIQECTTLENIVKKTLTIVRPSIENNNIKLITNLNCPYKISTFPSEVIQVLLNLIKNSEEALLEKEISDATIWIEAEQKKDKACLKISDNAGGISQKIIDKIFDPYFTTKVTQEGSGLGLYMSKIIIEEHCEGSLNVKNTKKGTSFSILLDLYE